MSEEAAKTAGVSSPDRVQTSIERDLRHWSRSLELISSVGQLSEFLDLHWVRCLRFPTKLQGLNKLLHFRKPRVDQLQPSSAIFRLLQLAHSFLMVAHCCANRSLASASVAKASTFLATSLPAMSIVQLTHRPSDSCSLTIKIDEPTSR